MPTILGVSTHPPPEGQTLIEGVRLAEWMSTDPLWLDVDPGFRVAARVVKLLESLG